MRTGPAQNDSSVRALRGGGQWHANGDAAAMGDSNESGRSQHQPPLGPPGPPGRYGRRFRGRFLSGLEWAFLIFGLLAIDAYVWVNVSASLDQAYGDWAFDQKLRGLQPSITGFIADEIGWIFGESRPAPATPQENAEKQTPLPAPSQRPKPLSPGVMVGRLTIPRLKLSVMVREGATESTLRRAVGHIPGTGLPGQLGNVGLAGHRDTFFRPLSKIKKDDSIDVETGGGTYRYVVTGTKIVSPRDVTVLNASAGKTLTLVTCYPFYYIGSAPKRFIVHAVEVSEVSSNNRHPQQPGS